MKKIMFFMFSSLLLTSSTAFSSPDAFHLMEIDFAAPSISNRNAIPADVQTGSIIYDSSNSTFYGLAGTGTFPNWVQLGTASAGQVVSSGASERVERLMFAGATATSNCTATTNCPIYSQSGSWATSVTRNGAGDYTVNVPPGVFSAPPVCTCSRAATGGTGAMCQINQSGTTTTAINLATVTSAGVADTLANVICMGPR